MAIKDDSLVFIGTQGILTFYVSKGKNIVRKKSSLDARRVKNDPAFKGFRKSSGRMQEASPIASALYRQIPARFREYSLYRILTGAALNLLKAGEKKDVISNRLKKEYIDPLITRIPSKRRVFVKQRPQGSSLFSYGELAACPPGISKQGFRTSSGLKYQEAGLVVTAKAPIVRNIADKEKDAQHRPAAMKEIPGLIYLGRLKEAPKLKMYRRVEIGFVIGMNPGVSAQILQKLLQRSTAHQLKKLPQNHF